MPPLAQWHHLLAFSTLAIKELVKARMDFATITVPEIQLRNAAMRDSKDAEGDSPLLAWITYIMPRIARRLPFRSDCLVQALAAQTWLAAENIASEIVIGAERPADKLFAAHAWLKCGHRIITGGETARYTVLL